MGSVRGSYCKGAVAGAKRHPMAAELLEALGEVRRRIRDSSMIGWVDAQDYLRLLEVTLDVLGADGSERFWAERLSEALGLPLMRPLVQGGLGMFGRHPGGLLRMTPQAYRLTYRGIGHPSVGLEEGHARLAISDLPPAFRGSPLVHNFAGHAIAALEYLEVEGAVVPDRRKLAEGTLVLDVTWSTEQR